MTNANVNNMFYDASRDYRPTMVPVSLVLDSKEMSLGYRVIPN